MNIQLVTFTGHSVVPFNYNPFNGLSELLNVTFEDEDEDEDQ